MIRIEERRAINGKLEVATAGDYRDEDLVPCRVGKSGIAICAYQAYYLEHGHCLGDELCDRAIEFEPVEAAVGPE